MSSATWSRDSRWVLGLACAAMAVDGYDVIVFGSAIPALRSYRSWDLSPETIGQIAAMAMVGMLIGALLSGPIASRIGSRWALISSVSWFSTAMIGVALSPSPEVLALARFLAGLGFGSVLPTAIALTVLWAPTGRSALSNALVQAGFPIGGILAAIAALSLLEDHGFRLMFLLGALPLITIVPLAIWKLPRTSPVTVGTAPSEPSQVRDNIRKVFSRNHFPTLSVFAIANFCSFLVVYALNTWLPELMRSAGFGLGSALSLLLTLNLGAIAGGALGSVVADRIGNKPVLTVGFIIAAVSLMLISFNPPQILLYVLIAIAGATTLGTQIVLFGYGGTSFPDGVRPIALGFTSGIGRFGAISGPILGGIMVGQNVGLLWSFGVFAAAALLGAVLSRFMPSAEVKSAGAPNVAAHL